MRKFSPLWVVDGLMIALFLNPVPEIAVQIVCDAYGKYSRLQKIRRNGRYKRALSDSAQFQQLVFLASAAWESDQESSQPQRVPKYRGSAFVIRITAVQDSAETAIWDRLRY